MDLFSLEHLEDHLQHLHQLIMPVVAVELEVLEE
jgi:hypothetical protein|tara:strand:+ start:116 stop:217 length:102 start_codon:yes stop_codon:yes gene_type:complete